VSGLRFLDIRRRRALATIAPSSVENRLAENVRREAPVKIICGFIAAAVLVASAGCASTRPVPSETTEDGLTRITIKGVDVAYVRKGADFKQYTKVILDPVQVAFDKDWDPKRTASNLSLPSEDRERIRTDGAKLFMDVFKKELEQDGGYPVVSAAGPDVMRLSTALVDVYVTAPDTMTAGRSRTYVMEAGRATLVAEVRDSETGAILGRLYDHRAASNTGSLQWSDSVSNSFEARRLFTSWAKLLRGRLDAVRAAPTTN
jgi:Protein of unknown function (DUF3313)